MPKNYKLAQWNGDILKNWAKKVGPYNYKIIEGLLKYYKVEEQAYKGCIGILKLFDKYKETGLEHACRLASSYISNLSYKNIKLILSSGQDLKEQEEIKSTDDDLQYACMRGKEYYGNNKQ